MLQEFSQEVENTVRGIVNEIHTALPGEILSFDAGSGTASVQPAGKYVTHDGKKMSYPRLNEVPLVFPFCQQAGVGIVFPVGKGDSCIVIVSEVELDSWRSGSDSEISLRYDLTSSMAIPGLLWGGGSLIEKAIKKNGVVIGASGGEVIVDDKGIELTTGETAITLSDNVIAIGGDIMVKGNIFYTGQCQKC